MKGDYVYDVNGIKELSNLYREHEKTLDALLECLKPLYLESMEPEKTAYRRMMTKVEDIQRYYLKMANILDGFGDDLSDFSLRLRRQIEDNIDFMHHIN